MIGARARVGWCLMPCAPGNGGQVVAGRGSSIGNGLCGWMT